MIPQSQISKRLAKPRAQSDDRQTPLTAQDHTLVMQAVMENVKPLAKKFGKKRPTGVEVLNALLKVRGVDARTKSIVRDALAVLPMIEKARKKMTPATKAAVEQVTQQLGTAQTTSQLIKNLKSVKKERTALKKSRAGAPNDSLITGVNLAIDILEDGLKTIYAPEILVPFLGANSVQRAARGPAAGTVAGADASGAVSGAVSGCLIGAAGGTVALPGGGTAAGCVSVGVIGGTANAIGSSAAKLFEMLL